jgi:pimeloyl-ACP methyl ester carboxylesterase
MKQAFENRELITLECQGLSIRGTVHHSLPSPADGDKGKRPGIVFLNSLTLPRAATGDSAVYWSDALAASGYPVFRVDLPGLGDSDGNLPAEILDYINSGGFATAAAALTAEIVRRFELSGVILAGHCAGSVSALFAVPQCSECRGVILLDPYFHLPRAIRPKVRQWLSEWVLRSATGRIVSNVYDQLRKIRLSLGGERLPDNANSALIRIWSRIAPTGLPILFLKAPSRKAVGTKPRQGEFDYFQYVLKAAGRKHRVTVEVVEGTDHSFANRHGRAVVEQHMEMWLNRHFPTGQPVSRGDDKETRQSGAYAAEVSAGVGSSV